MKLNALLEESLFSQIFILKQANQLSDEIVNCICNEIDFEFSSEKFLNPSQEPAGGGPRGAVKYFLGAKIIFFAPKTCFLHGSEPNLEKDSRAPKNIF